MNPPKVYTVPKAYWLFPVVITGLTIYFFVHPLDMFTRFMMLLAAGLAWGTFITTPQRIELTPDGQMRLDGLLKQTRLYLTDISKVELHNKQIVVHHRDGKIIVPNLIFGFDKLATELHQRNPDIKLEDGILLRLGKSPQKMALLVGGIVAGTLVFTFAMLYFFA